MEADGFAVSYREAIQIRGIESLNLAESNVAAASIGRWTEHYINVLSYVVTWISSAVLNFLVGAGARA